MLHGIARSVIDLLQGSTAFGRRAVAANLLGYLTSSGALSKNALESGLEHLRNMPADRVDDGAPIPDLGTAPNGLDELCNQLITLVVDHPQHIGLQLQRLWCLCQLWPHGSREERQQLRTAFIVSIRAERAPEGSYLTRATLRSWQRSIPTWMSSEKLSTVDLESLTDYTNPQQAHFALASFLGSESELPTLAQILHTLGNRLLLHHFDDQGVLIDNVVGCSLFAGIAEHCPAPMMAIIISQLAHNLWWCANDGSLKRLASGSHDNMPLEDAIRSGDMIAASRAARQHVNQQQDPWPLFLRSLESFILSNERAWDDAVAFTTATWLRTGRDSKLNPDQAAALATTYSALSYLNTHGSRPFRAAKG
ncbi:MAG: hypothetical protein ACOCXA_03860 [Planctomycetota bacterium]